MAKSTFLTKLGGSEFRVLRLQEAPPGRDTLDTPQAVNAYLRAQLPGSPVYHPDVENFLVVYLSTRRKPIGWSVISTGTLDTILVHPREVFKGAIVANAAAIVLGHNHPSGDPSPSEADIKVTRDLMRAGQLLKIEVLDHLILGLRTPERPQDYCSLREAGFFTL